MDTEPYSNTPHPVNTLLTWVESGEIALTEIQSTFVSAGMSVRNLAINRGDKHRLVPQKHLKQAGACRGSYNPMAKVEMDQSEINIAIDNMASEVYCAELRKHASGGTKSYNTFLVEQRRRMAAKIRQWVEVL